MNREDEIPPKRESSASPAVEFLAAEIMNTHQIEADKAKSAFDIFASTEEEITGNAKGGAGFYAEAHHAASSGSTRLGSHEFGSADILNGDGKAFNPKYYADASDTFHAGAELIKDPITGIETAKYAGQTIVVPSDQLDQVNSLHQQSIQDAIHAGNQAQLDALHSISFSDHVVNGDFHSTPLSYADAQQGQALFGDDILPDYAHETSFTDHSLATAESGLLAFVLTISVEMAPIIITGLADIASGTASPEEFKRRLINGLQSKSLHLTTLKVTGAAISSGILALIDGIDATGATIIVTVAINILGIVKKYQNNEISKNQFYMDVAMLVAQKSAWSIAVKVSYGLMGPAGIVALMAAKMTTSAVNAKDKFDMEYGIEWSNTFEGSTTQAKTNAIAAQGYTEAIKETEKTIEIKTDNITKTDDINHKYDTLINKLVGPVGETNG